VLDEAARSASRFLKIDIPDRKPASIAAGLKEAIRRDPNRFGTFTVYRRAGQVFLGKREEKLHRVA
jgi:hypothetical protein